MPTAIITTGGRLTLPREFRIALGLQPGDRVEFLALASGFKLTPVTKDIRALKGRFAGRVDRPVAVHELSMDTARIVHPDS